MRLQPITRYAIDGQEFETPKKAAKHIEERVFKHIQKGTECAGWGSEPSKMRLELMAYILANREDLAALLSADLSVTEDD
jgi:hypothetical protein